MTEAAPSPSVTELLSELPGGVPDEPDGNDGNAHVSVAVYSSRAIASTQDDQDVGPGASHLKNLQTESGSSNGKSLKGAVLTDGALELSGESRDEPLIRENGLGRGAHHVPATATGRRDEMNEPAAQHFQQAHRAETRPVARAWLRDRQAVDLALMKGRVLLFICGTLGTVLPIAQNELVLTEHDPLSSLMNFLKFCNGLVSLAMLGLLLRQYRLVENFSRIRMHLRALHPLDTNVPVLAPLRKPSFWVEALICVPFLPPFVTFELIMHNWMNIVMYRAETVFCLYNSFRLYLCLPVRRDYELSRLPKRHTISLFTNTGMDSQFAFKRILNGHDAMLVIGIFWAASFLITGYWFRAAEISACSLATAIHPECNVRAAKIWTLESDSRNEFEKRNDLYLWNAFWGMFITATSVGYGDILATTHAGRIVAAVAATAGLVFTAALTAALSIKLTWNDKEHAALLVVKREQARRTIRNFAVKLLQNWVRASSKKTSPEKRVQLLRENWQIKRDFAETKAETKVDLADCLADSAKFDDIYQRTKYIFEAIHDIEAKTRPEEAQAMQFPSCAVSGGDVFPTPLPAVERQESFIVKRALENVQKQQSRKDASLKMVKKSIKKPSATENGTEESLRKIKLHQKIRDLAKVAGTSAYLARQGQGGAVVSTDSGLTSELPQNLHIDQPAISDARTQAIVTIDWRRNRVKIGDRLSRCQIGLSVLAIFASMIVMGQNEWVIRGNNPRASICEVSKLFSLICCLVMFALLYYQYWLHNILRRLNLHLKRGHDFNPKISVSDVLSSRSFWVEVVLCCICLPPGTTGELVLQSMDNIVVYRWETIMASWNILGRLYLQWNIVCAWTLSDVPNRQNVAAFANIQFDSLFVMKRLVNSWSAGKHLFLAWTFCTLIFGYLYRNAEISACSFSYTQSPDCLKPEAQTWVVYGNKFEKANDLFIWNAMWLSFVTMTTVGYGDSEGREQQRKPQSITEQNGSARDVLTLQESGILLASLITAAITNLLTYTQSELSAISVIEREQARVRMRKTAVTILTLWWRRMKGTKLSRRLAKLDRHVLRREFLEYKLETMQEVEDLQGMSVKMHKVLSHIKHIEVKLEDIAQHLWSKEDVLSKEQQWENKATALDLIGVADTDGIGMDDLIDRVSEEIEEI